MRLYPLPIALPLCIFALSACIATAFSINPEFSVRGDFARGESFFTIITYVLLTLAFAFCIQTFQQAAGLIRALCISACLIALYALIEFVCLQRFGISPLQYFRPPQLRQSFISATMGNANFLGRFLVLMLPLMAACCVLAVGRHRALLWAAACMCAVAAITLTYSRASLLGMAVGVPTFIILTRSYPRCRRRLGLMLGGGLVLIIGIGLLSLVLSGTGSRSFFTTVTDRAVSALDLQQGDGLATRMFTWKHSIPVILERPLFGHGPDTGFDALEQVNFKTAVQFNAIVILDRIHNNYLDIALTQGLIGLGAYLAVLIVFMAGLLKTIRAPGVEPEACVLLCGLLSGFAGCLVNDFFTFSTVSVSMTFWTLIGIGCAIQSFHKT